MIIFYRKNILIVIENALVALCSYLLVEPSETASSAKAAAKKAKEMAAKMHLEYIVDEVLTLVS